MTNREIKYYSIDEIYYLEGYSRPRIKTISLKSFNLACGLNDEMSHIEFADFCWQNQPEQNERLQVNAFLEKHKQVEDFINALPPIIKKVFGDVTLHLKYFRCYEESWENIIVEIESKHNVDKLMKLEDKLFKRLEKNKDFTDALLLVTISCE